MLLRFVLVLFVITYWLMSVIIKDYYLFIKYKKFNNYFIIFIN